MSDYFKYFPKVKYSNRSAVNITQRTKILDDLANDPYIYLPYTVINDDRPENIAEFYYGSPNKVWLIYYANNIIDMYSQWPLSSSDFNNHLMKKYGELSGETGFSVIAWTQNTTIQENIIYYQSKTTPNVRINTYTYDSYSIPEKSNWEPLRYYDYETILNDNKRNIYLIDNSFADRFETDLRTALNE